jgi:probable HAF family extracellular repeat protein
MIPRPPPALSPKASIARDRSSGTTTTTRVAAFTASFSAAALTYSTLDDTVAFFGTTLASGINASGQIVGYYDNSTGRHGFLYNPNGGTYTPLDDPSGSSGTTQALGINDLGQIVGSYGDSNHHPHGFLCSGGASGTYTTIDDPSALTGGDTFAQAINASGQIVGWYSDSANHQHGFLYDGRTYTTLGSSAASPPIPRPAQWPARAQRRRPDRRVLPGRQRDAARLPL